MPAIIIYLLKVITCSAVLAFYYRIALRNKHSHQWNRFYLLGSTLASILLPLVNISIATTASATTPTMVRLLDVVTTTRSFSEHEEAGVYVGFSYLYIAYILYAIIIAAFFFTMVKGLVRLQKISRKYPQLPIGGAKLVLTEEEDAPFSWFRKIFWNTRIDLQSESGSRILQHELVHVHEQHSADRVFMNLVVALFWCNPFFWFMRKEITHVHEFIADAKTIDHDDLPLFSEMILSSAFPVEGFGITSRFSSSSIKRRLFMLTVKRSPVRFAARVLILPVLFILFAAFSLHRKPVFQSNPLSDKKFTIVIDAGHGGDRSGATAGDGTSEKSVVLALAQKVKQMNSDPAINIVLTRNSDQEVSQRDRVKEAATVKADAFISLHMNSSDPAHSGIDFIVSKRDLRYTEPSQLLGSIFSRQLEKVYPVSGELIRGREEGGIWVLDAPEISYPSLMIEVGNIRNSKDLAFVKSEANQEQLAKQMLAAITEFAMSKFHPGQASIHTESKWKGTSITVEKGNIVLALDNNTVVDVDPTELVSASASTIFIDNLDEINKNSIVVIDGKVVPDLAASDVPKIRILQVAENIKSGNKTRLVLISTDPGKPAIRLPE